MTTDFYSTELTHNKPSICHDYYYKLKLAAKFIYIISYHTRTKSVDNLYTNLLKYVNYHSNDTTNMTSAIVVPDNQLIFSFINYSAIIL